MKRIIIRNFGPFADLDFIINKKFNIFIGEQAAGKSTLAKLVYFFRDISDFFPMISFGAYIRSDFNMNNIKTLFIKNLEKNFLSCFSQSIMETHTYLECIYDEEKYVQISFDKNNKVKIVFSNNILIELEKIILQWNNILSNVHDTEKVFQVLESYESNIKKIFNDDKEALYIPAARSFLSTFTDNLYDNLRNESLDYTLRRFISAVNAFKGIKRANDPLIKFKNYIKDKTDENLLTNILIGQYLLEKNKEYIIINNRKIPLMFASSGQQESLWILNFLILSIVAHKKFFFVIEEPEAHLFTNSQFDIIKFIAMNVNLTDSEVFITTHSPYILNAVNLLMYSGKVEKESINANSIIDILYRIDPNEVGAFYIKEGKLIDIIDPDEMLIQSEKIDEASSGINLLFDKLISLELNKQNGENNVW